MLHINRVEIEGNNAVGYGTRLENVFLGKYSYIGINCKIESTAIGRYSSIGSNVWVANGEHPTKNFVSTHPVFYSTHSKWGRCYVEEDKYNEHKYADEKRKLSVIIGNDVWIADNVVLLNGITIGDGAIIAAGSVVTKDVEPYCIVAGVPAQIKKKRFTDEVITKLLNIQWWNRGDEWIRQNAHYFDDAICFVNMDCSTEKRKNDCVEEYRGEIK